MSRSGSVRARGHPEHNVPEGAAGGREPRADAGHREAARGRDLALAAAARRLGRAQAAPAAAAGPVPADRGALPHFR